jgi:hypothetical protein
MGTTSSKSTHKDGHGTGDSLTELVISAKTMEQNMTRRVVDDSEANYLLLVMRNFVEHFGMYVTMAIFASGIFGNALSVVIFWRLRRHDVVTTTYLAPVAVYDLTVLCIGLSGWLDEAAYSFSNGAVHIPEAYTAGHCKFRTFLKYSCGMMSAWTLVTFCIERCVAIRKPLKVATIFTPSRRRKLLALVILLSLVFGVFPIPSYTIFPSGAFDGGNVCMGRPSNTILARGYNQFGSICTFANFYTYCLKHITHGRIIQVSGIAWREKTR